jgi:predicted metalloprotease
MDLRFEPCDGSNKSRRIIKRIVISTARHDKGLEVRKEAGSRHISVEFADPVFDNTFSKGHQESQPRPHQKTISILKI